MDLPKSYFHLGFAGMEAGWHDEVAGKERDSKDLLVGAGAILLCGMLRYAYAGQGRKGGG